MKISHLCFVIGICQIVVLYQIDMQFLATHLEEEYSNILFSMGVFNTLLYVPLLFFIGAFRCSTGTKLLTLVCLVFPYMAKESVQCLNHYLYTSNYIRAVDIRNELNTFILMYTFIAFIMRQATYEVLDKQFIHHF